MLEYRTLTLLPLLLKNGSNGFPLCVRIFQAISALRFFLSALLSPRLQAGAADDVQIPRTLPRLSNFDARTPFIERTLCDRTYFLRHATPTTASCFGAVTPIPFPRGLPYPVFDNQQLSARSDLFLILGKTGSVEKVRASPPSRVVRVPAGTVFEKRSPSSAELSLLRYTSRPACSYT